MEVILQQSDKIFSVFYDLNSHVLKKNSADVSLKIGGKLNDDCMTYNTRSFLYSKHFYKSNDNMYLN